MASEKYAQSALFLLGSKDRADCDLLNSDRTTEKEASGCSETDSIDKIVVLEEGPSVPYFKIKLEMLEKWSKIEQLENFSANDKALSKYKNPKKVKSDTRKKIKRLPGEIRSANRRLVGEDILKARGVPEVDVDIELYELSAYIHMKNKYSGHSNTTLRAAEIDRLRETLGK